MTRDGRYQRIEATLALRAPPDAALTEGLADAVGDWVGQGWILVDSDAIAVHDDGVRVSYVPGGDAGAARMAEWLDGFARRHAGQVTGLVLAAGRDFWLADQRRCTCEAPPAFLVTSTGFVNTPPLRCIGCGGDVPLADHLPRQVLSPLLGWHGHFTHLHELWLDAAGPYAQWARHELEFVDSLFNLEGRDVTAHVARATGREAYYELFFQLYDEHASYQPSTERSCPGCWRPWERHEDRVGPELWCARCHLARYAPVAPSGEAG